MTDSNDEAPPDERSVALRGRIRRVCQTVRYAAAVWFVWNTILTLWVWTHRAEYLDQTLRFRGIDPASVTEFGFWSAFALALVDLAVVAYLVWTIWRLMRSYIDGDIFTVSAARQMRAVAQAGFYATGVDIAARVATASLLSTQIFAKAPLLSWLSPQDLLYALISGFILALASIFGTAAEIAKEHAEIV